ncbi:MAG: AMP-binding protein [Leptolyngbyaceae cyanobacterium]
MGQSRCSSELIDSFSTLVDLLSWRASRQPEKVAYVFMVDGKTEGARLTYAELDRQARIIGAWLQRQKAEGERALLLYPQSLDAIAAFWGCLYADVIAIPAPAPEPSRLKRTLPRLQAIAKDAQVAFVLSTHKIISLVAQARHDIPEFRQMQWLATEGLGTDLAETWQEPAIKGDTLAYLQYTSGSTSTPKGVMISHRNVLFHCAYLQKACGYTPDSVTVTWMPYFHDYGLVEGLTEPLYNGTPCYVMSPFTLIRRPFNWLQTISRYRATHSQAPNFAYDLCIRRITPEQRAELDLSCWRAAGNAAEPINPTVLEQFMRIFASCGFRAEASCPAYGLAEATLLVSSSPQTELPVIANLQAEALEQERVVEADSSSKLVRRIPSCGQLVCDTQVAIVNPKTLYRCLPNEVGEIWVSDPSVAQGYWNRPDATESTFEAYLADTGEGPFLRTGDLGFMRNGHLFISSRMKDVIIIRGANHYPQDIEWTVQGAHPAMRPENGAAFSLVINGEERLVITQEVQRSHLKQLDQAAAFEAIRRAISEQHEVQVYAILLLRAGSIPKTSSGKIQRSACRQGYRDGDLETIATWTAPIVEMPVSSGQSSKTHMALHNLLYPTSATSSESPSTLNGATAHGAVVNGSAKGISQSNSKTKTDQLIRWLRAYGNERVNSRIIDERRCIPPYIVLDLGNRGLLGMQVPTELGGLGLSNVDSIRLYEQLGAIDQAMALVVFNHNILGVRPILKYGSDEARNTLVPTLAAGRELAAFALSEPGAGSNPRAIATKAIPDGKDAWRLIEGTKYWSGMAAWAGVINVFAQTYNEQGEPRGISGFAVRQGTLGLRQGPEAMTVGMRGMIQNTIYLEGARVTQSQLLSGVGQGMDAAQDAMMYGRLVIGSFGLGGMKKCTQLMLRYATRRSVSTGRLLDNPVTLARLGELNAEITCLEVLITRIAELLDAGRFVPVEPYVVCKVAGAESFFRATDRLIQMLGGRGYVEPNIAPQLLRDARVCRIFEGPTETLNLYLGSRVLNQGDELHHFISNVLGCTAIANNLRIAAEQIRERSLGSQSPFTDRTASLRWASALAGEVAIFAIFLAVLKEAFRNSESQRLRLAGDWAQLKFEQACKIALGGSATESTLRQADIVTAMIADYGESIGDLEQTLAGEDLELDPILRQETVTTPTPLHFETQSSKLQAAAVAEVVTWPSAKAQDVTSSLAEESSESSSSSQTLLRRSAQSIQQWIINLLIQDWKIPTEAIAPSKTFADYGLDSVMAVNLAQELEDWLKIPLEATLVWNFPTVESLSKHLINEINEATQNAQADSTSDSDLSAEASSSSSIDESSPEDLDALSDAEMADLLAEELATAKRRKTK